MDNEIKNASGCTDITAFEAIRNVRREERRKLIEELKAVAQKHGYRITGKIQLQDIEYSDNQEV